MKHIKLFEAFVNENKSAYGDEYSEAGFNLMQKDLEEALGKYSFDYYIDNPKSKQVEYKIEGLDGGVSITVYRNYGNYFGKFYLYIYSDKLKPSTQTAKLNDKKELNDTLGKVAKLFNVMSPEQAAMKKQIDDLRYELEDALYMYGDSDKEQKAARNTSKFKSLAKKVDALQAKYNKTYE